MRKMKLNRTKTLIFYWAPVFIYCLLIFFQSSNPSPKNIPTFPYSDKMIHFIMYGVLAVLFYRAINTHSISSRIILISSIMFAGVYGASDEIHQSFVPFREAEFLDFVADIIGGIVGGVMCHVFFGRVKVKRQNYISHRR